MIPTKKVLDIPVTCLPFEEQIMLILRWARVRASKVVCLANVHMLMEANRKPSFAKVLNKADLVTPDGKPLVLMLRRLGIKHQNQVAGMDVFLNLCDLAEQAGISVYFLGSTEGILQDMKQRLNREYPLLRIAGMKSIPFVSIEDIVAHRDRDLITEINQSGAGIVFTCLGCPKQEIWMSEHQGLIDGVMVGVGAVFSMYAGINPRAPHWIQQVYLEWLYRFLQEPRRLWRRYGSTIPPFLFLATKQLMSRYEDRLKKLQGQWQLLSDRNVAIDIETLDFSPEKIGNILLKQGEIDKEQLKQALSIQKLNSNSKLGEILVHNHLISLSQLKFYLKNQNIKLGRLLVEKRFISQRALKNALLLQKDSDAKIGKILVQNKLISEDNLQEVIIEHYLRRKGLFLIDNTSSNKMIFTSKIEQESTVPV